MQGASPIPEENKDQPTQHVESTAAPVFTLGDGAQAPVLEFQNDDERVISNINKRLGSLSIDPKTAKENKPAKEVNENNNNESYISGSVGDSADSARDANAPSPKNSDLGNSARKSGRSEDRLGGMFTALIEPSLVPTLDHEIKGAYQLEVSKNSSTLSPAELATSQTGSEGGITINLPAQNLPKELKQSRPPVEATTFLANQTVQSLSLIENVHSDDILEKSDLQSFVKSQQLKRQSSQLRGDDSNDLSQSLNQQRQPVHDRCETESAQNSRSNGDFQQHRIHQVAESEKSEEELKQQQTSSFFENMTNGVGQPLAVQMQSRSTFPAMKMQTANFFAASGNVIQSHHTEEQKESVTSPVASSVPQTSPVSQFPHFTTFTHQSQPTQLNLHQQHLNVEYPSQPQNHDSPTFSVRDIWPRSSVLNVDTATVVPPKANSSRQHAVQNNIGGNPIPPDASDLSFEEPDHSSINQLSQLAAQNAPSNMLRFQQLAQQQQQQSQASMGHQAHLPTFARPKQPSASHQSASEPLAPMDAQGNTANSFIEIHVPLQQLNGCKCEETTTRLGILYDARNRTVSFFKNGINQGVAFTNIASGMQPSLDVWFQTGEIEILPAKYPSQKKPLKCNF